MKLVSFVAVATLAAAAPAGAQQTVDVQIPDSAKHQVLVFESNLRAAIQRGAQNLADRARQVVPDVILRFEAEPVVTGLLLPDYGAIFYAQIPGIQEVGLKLWSMNREATSSVSRVASGAGGRVGATGIVEADPAVPPLTDPDKEYTAFMRSALVDAILDNALALPVAEGETLTLIAGDVTGRPQDPLARQSRRLILRIKGEDLIALRLNRITRDEARARIKESRY